MHPERLAVLTGLLFLSTVACSNDAPTTPAAGASASGSLGAAGASAGTTPGLGTAGSRPVGTAGTAAAPAVQPSAAGKAAPAAAAGGGGSTAPAAGKGAAGGGSPEVRGPGGPRTAAGFVNLAPPMGEPLDGKGKDLTPAAPAGWVWYEIDGAICRDGSPTGFYVHTGTANKLMIYLEGGGACSNTGFCGFNPTKVDSVLAGDGQTVINTALGAIDGRQQPGVYTTAEHTVTAAGVFDFANAKNPVKDWSQVYVPYCTGDVHFGTKKGGSVPGLENQNFVGYTNMKLFMSRIVPTFKSTVDQVILTGASAGGFGAALNFSMVQDSFGETQVDVISDSGPPFDDKFMPVCMQKRWRESWGFEGSLPPDCAECRQADGGGLLKLADFLLKKHPSARIGIISTMQDEVIRLFYSVGIADCKTYDTADPVDITVGQVLDPTMLFDAATYTAGLNDLRTRYADTKRYASFYMAGEAPNLHQHIFRTEFFDTFSGTTQADWFAGFIAGKVETVGP